jgi:hypothetical protein
VSPGLREVGEQDVYVDQGIAVEDLRRPGQSREPSALCGWDALRGGGKCLDEGGERILVSADLELGEDRTAGVRAREHKIDPQVMAALRRLERPTVLGPRRDDFALDIAEVQRTIAVDLNRRRALHRHRPPEGASDRLWILRAIPVPVVREERLLDHEGLERAGAGVELDRQLVGRGRTRRRQPVRRVLPVELDESSGKCGVRNRRFSHVRSIAIWCWDLAHTVHDSPLDATGSPGVAWLTPSSVV